MPKSKHRRKPVGKLVAYPGRGKPGKPLSLSWLEELEFDWADRIETG